MIKKIDHIVITTSDPAACLSFYESCGFRLGKNPGRHELFAGDFKINVHKKGEELSPHATNVKTGSADFCFEIDGSLTAFRSQLERNGLTVSLGIVARSGANGAMNSIYLRDPDGNLVEFASYE